MSGSSEQLRDELSRFQSTLEGFGNPFGEDEIGSLMQSVYDVIREAAMESFEDNITRVGETGGEVVAMAEDYAEVDRANSDLFGELLGGMGR